MLLLFELSLLKREKKWKKVRQPHIPKSYIHGSSYLHSSLMLMMMITIITATSSPSSFSSFVAYQMYIGIYICIIWKMSTMSYHDLYVAIYNNNNGAAALLLSSLLLLRWYISAHITYMYILGCLFHLTVCSCWHEKRVVLNGMDENAQDQSNPMYMWCVLWNVENEAQ